MVDADRILLTAWFDLLMHWRYLEKGTISVGIILGIDLGYSSSRVGYVDEFGMFRIIPSVEGNLSTPSVVYFELDASILVGQQALEMSFRDPMRSVRFCKNYFGEPTYTITVDDKEYSMKNIATFILQKIVGDAEDSLGQTIDGAIIACPSYFNGAAKKDMIDAIQAVVLSNGDKLRVLSVLPDAHAIAVAYNQAHRFLKSKNLLVYDLGGGSFNCAIVKTQGSGLDSDIKIITNGGDHWMLGATDWDHALVCYLSEKLCDCIGEDFEEASNDPDMALWLRNTADTVKRKLSHRYSVSVYPPYERKEAKVDITREIFEELTEKYLNETIRLVNEMMDEAQLSVEQDVDEIVLVGGGANMPQVWKRLEQEYRKTIVTIDMEFAVVKGLAFSEKKIEQHN